MSFTWFPGHMRKALRQIEADTQGTDVVLMLLDARVPASSRNLVLEGLLRQRGKSLVYILHKADLAEPPATARWLEALQRSGDEAVAMSSVKRQGKSQVVGILKRRHEALVARAQKKGMHTDVLRAMIVGIPNVGKSTLINQLSEQGRAKAGKRPGLTRGRQFVWLSEGIELLDTPGVMPPGKLDDDTLLPLAMIGAIKEELLPLEELAPALYRVLSERHWLKRIHPHAAPSVTAWWDALCRDKGFILKGGEPDLRRAILFLLKGLREGKWGPLTLEEAQGVGQRGGP
ncbi:MAG TPA: ribosome biogenesis GTPase YlqF [Candidatus Xenobia bacterium]